MAGWVRGKQILMSGVAIIEDGEDLFVDDGNGTTLRLAWDRVDDNSSGSGSFSDLLGNFPFDAKGDHCTGFGVGEGGLMKWVRCHGQRVGTSRIVNYTVLLYNEKS